MTFKRYLSIDQAIAYLSENQPFNSELEGLQELERFGQIKPLIYLTDVLFSKDITFNSLDGDRILRGDVSAVSGYFKPSDFIFLDRYTLNPYREHQDEYFELKLFDGLEIEHLTSSSDKLSKGDKGIISGIKGFSDQLVTEVPCELVFISRAELDALFSTETKSDDKTINELNQRIKQLEQQLEQSSQQSGTPNAKYTTDAMEALNAVVDKYWLDYDPEQKNATKQHTIKEFVKENYPMITDSMALWIDRIARHPSAK
ncbi:hypothetical protein [Psychrobacter sanguinis]|uniref:hypothetical protein n=1 Tax=Psychrobacter sanguinis TaxID=861445 RepID=UPI00191AA73B|nr:hypothetical protein [Psychrobacter sanguinis]MCC3345640.1 hypothetical protein [Psychrobacter sanguinis]